MSIALIGTNAQLPCLKLILNDVIDSLFSMASAANGYIKRCPKLSAKQEEYPLPKKSGDYRYTTALTLGLKCVLNRLPFKKNGIIMKAVMGSISKILVLLASISFSATTTANSEAEQEVIDFVDQAVLLLNAQGQAALASIGQTDGDFHNGSQYVFVYDENVVMLAHPVKPKLVGRSYKGKPDVKGKKFRDEIVNNALNGGGWTEYVYQKPNTSSGLFKKKVYSRLAENDGLKFVVASGMYLGEL